jgi:hypothetical protein
MGQCTSKSSEDKSDVTSSNVDKDGDGEDDQDLVDDDKAPVPK